MKIIKRIDNSKLDKFSNKEIAELLRIFIEAHKSLEPAFVVNFWFPIQMENHPLREKWEKEIEVAARTRARTEQVGPLGSKAAIKLAEEINKRMFGDRKYTRAISLSEAYNFLLQGKLPSLPEIKRRKKHYVYGSRGIKYISIGKYAVMEGHIIRNFFKSKKNLKELKGQTAFKGKAIGRAKIIVSKKDFAKIGKGDILVAEMTTPEFFPVMKKAAGFVTNEGGITSHAAIVARELKKPCVIGTKIATKVLRDGDLVEVDAEKGIVKILKKVK